jgi:hypothetical protein
MKALSVIELSKLYDMNRQSIYKRIAKGDLSKNSDGKIDLSEAIRVFGEPSQRRNQNVTLQSQATLKSAEVDILRQQVDILKKQLELAQEREIFQREQLQAKDDQISSLQLLLSAPKNENVVEEKFKVEHEILEEKIQPELKAHIPETSSEPKRRGLFNRVVRAIFD